MRKNEIVCVLVLGASLLARNVAGQKPENATTPRPPHAHFTELRLGQIRPSGWLRLYLEKLRDGLGGKMAQAAGYPFNTCMWNGPEIPPNAKQNVSAWPAYEQSGYYIDGIIRLGYLLGDQDLLQRAAVQYNYALEHQAPNGEIGPAFIEDRWCRVPFFRGMMAQYEMTGDQRIPAVLTKFYLGGLSDFAGGREVCHLEIICWLYEITKDKRLLDLAEKAMARTDQMSSCSTVPNMLSATIPYLHGVTFNETAKLPAILYMYNGNETLLSASQQGFEKLAQHHGLIDGVNCSQERTMGRFSLCRHETCDISDFTWSMGYLLMASGKAMYGDAVERAIFNAGMGAITKDFKAFQYFSSPNQADATMNSWHMSGGLFGSHMMYRPDQGPACCNGNMVRFLPNYVARMWMWEPKTGGVVASLYGPGSVTVDVGAERRPVTIVENTKYPFTETVEFQIQSKDKVRFPLWLRVPAWTEGPTITVNGAIWKGKLAPGRFAVIERDFAPGDKIVLNLPMAAKVSSWPLNGLGLEHGPLVYTLPVQTDAQISGYSDDKREFPRYEMVGKSNWSYALDLAGSGDAKKIEVVRNAVPDDPWKSSDSPVCLKVPAYPIPAWSFDYKAREQKDGTVLYYPHTPELPNPWSVNEMSGYRKKDTKATLTLVPYGRTLLRMTIFPSCVQYMGKSDQVEHLIDGSTDASSVSGEEDEDGSSAKGSPAGR